LSITHQQEILKSQSNPLKPRIIARTHSNLARFHWFCSIHPLPRAVVVTDYLLKPVKTCQNKQWFCKHSQKAEIARWKLFFPPNYKSFPIQTGFEQLASSIRWVGMAIQRRDVFRVLKFSPIFCVLSIISATDMLESRSRALKTRSLA